MKDGHGQDQQRRHCVRGRQAPPSRRPLSRQPGGHASRAKPRGRRVSSACGIASRRRIGRRRLVPPARSRRPSGCVPCPLVPCWLGAMVFGGVVHERLQLNEGTLWAGVLATHRQSRGQGSAARGAAPAGRSALHRRRRAGQRSCVAQQPWRRPPISRSAIQPDLRHVTPSRRIDAISPPPSRASATRSVTSSSRARSSPACWTRSIPADPELRRSDPGRHRRSAPRRRSAARDRRGDGRRRSRDARGQRRRPRRHGGRGNP